MANNKLKQLKREQNKKMKLEEAQKQQDLNDRIKIWSKLRNDLINKDEVAASKLLFPFQNEIQQDPKLIKVSK